MNLNNIILECRHCEKEIKYKKDIDIEPGNECFECNVCGCQFFSIKKIK